jgi:predicted PurR-regulated permease PerM
MEGMTVAGLPPETPLERVRRAGSLAWAVFGLVALMVALGVVAWWVRVIWPPLILAGAVCFLLNPAVTRLQHHHIHRVLGTALAYLAFFGVVVAVGLVVVPLGADQADQLADEWPELRADVESWIDDRAAESDLIPSVAEIEGELEAESDGSIGDRLDRLRDIGVRIFRVALVLLLAPIIAFYLLVDLPRLRTVAESLLPERSKREVLHVARRLNRAIGGIFRGQLMVALIVGVMVSIGLAVIGLPFWLIVGMVAGLFNIIPLIGPWVGAVPGIVIALTTRDVATALWVVAIMAGAQQIDNHFISPLVMRRAVRLHPAAVMLALLAGGTLGGFLGLLLAVPAAATLKIVVGHAWRHFVLGQPLDEIEAAWERDDTEPAVGVVAKVSDQESGQVYDDGRRRAGTADGGDEQVASVEGDEDGDDAPVTGAPVSR